MKIPPKRSAKIQQKLTRLSKIPRGECMELKEPATAWRHAIVLHQYENKSRFTLRSAGVKIFLYREK